MASSLCLQALALQVWEIRADRVGRPQEAGLASLVHPRSTSFVFATPHFSFSRWVPTGPYSWDSGLPIHLSSCLDSSLGRALILCFLPPRPPTLTSIPYLVSLHPIVHFQCLSDCVPAESVIRAAGQAPLSLEGRGPSAPLSEPQVPCLTLDLGASLQLPTEPQSAEGPGGPEGACSGVTRRRPLLFSVSTDGSGRSSWGRGHPALAVLARGLAGDGVHKAGPCRAAFLSRAEGRKAPEGWAARVPQLRCTWPGAGRASFRPQPPSEPGVRMALRPLPPQGLMRPALTRGVPSGPELCVAAAQGPCVSPGQGRGLSVVRSQGCTEVAPPLDFTAQGSFTADSQTAPAGCCRTPTCRVAAALGPRASAQGGQGRALPLRGLCGPLSRLPSTSAEPLSLCWRQLGACLMTP